jgi:hypothetical protein
MIADHALTQRWQLGGVSVTRAAAIISAAAHRTTSSTLFGFTQSDRRSVRCGERDNRSLARERSMTGGG